MFEWKVEEMQLRNERQDFKHRYYLEDEVSTEDKIMFLDQMQDGKMSYLLDLIDKYNQDLDSFPKDKWGSPKTVSFNAWLKRNDTRNMVSRDYKHGKIYFIGMERYIQDVENRYDLVNELFHRQLIECRRMEDSYFKEHDEYEILKEKFKNSKHDTTFGVHISSWSSGRICVCSEDDHERDITVEELKDLLDKYDQLDKLIEKLTAETHIVY